jgi:phosphohistidine swiveling domain-containing protein
MKPYILPLSDSQASLETVGGKGMSLAKLARSGLPVPDGFHITTQAYRQFVSSNNLQAAILDALHDVDNAHPATLDTASRKIGRLFAEAGIPGELASAIVAAYGAFPGMNPPVAVRSSATAEDLPEASFAGQQDTYLNICGADQVLAAVQKCWASLWTARAIDYRARHNIPPESVALAVVVQMLADAEAAGILFTANPLNGNRDEMLVNAAWGLGEAVVGGMVTPDSITIKKCDGSMVSRQTGEKLVMTVRTETGTAQQPVPEVLRNVPVLNDEQAMALGRYGIEIETLYGAPMDIEWALADGKFAILQARPITALPELEPPVTIEWKPPNPKGQYMRGSVVDLMPDPVSPLFETLAIPALSHVGVKEVLRPLTRSEPLLPDDYITTINEYAYMSFGYNLRQWWWVVTRMLLSMPRIMRMAMPLWRDVIRPRYVQTIEQWQDRPVETMPLAELWTGIQENNNAAMMHMASLLVATTGASAGAEGLFTQVYQKMIKRDEDPAATVFLMGYDITPILAEKSLYDLAMWCRQHVDLAAYLLETPTERLSAQLETGSAPVADWPDFCARLQENQKTYGHIIYDLDFAKPLPLDDPSPKLGTIKMYLRDQGTDPHERQRAAEEKRLQSAEIILKRLKGLRRWAFRKTLGMAQTMAQVRENALSDIGLGYPILRKMLRELGHRFTQAGWIEQDEDIYWLKLDEVQAAIASLERRGPATSLAGQVARRKETHQTLKRLTPPPTLPPKKKFLGFNLADFTPAPESSQARGTLKGVPASPGQATAPACVLHGVEDFEQMRPGYVLVASTTTPAWTPLFAMASAIVTDIGGPLSHGSIVAREYGIPAVMGTGVATRRIHDEQKITVDGTAGIVTLEKEA